MTLTLINELLYKNKQIHSAVLVSMMKSWIKNRSKEILSHTIHQN